jgi:energy-coupling factor transporter transmembrane protein EcfT
MTGFLVVGAKALSQGAWLRRVLHPRSLVLSSLLFIVLIVLPWKYLVPWRPQGLPPTAVELVFIAAKLTLTAVLSAVAASLMIRVAAGTVPPPSDPREAAEAA